MLSAVKNGWVNEANRELVKRIERTDEIKDVFRGSFAGYARKTGGVKFCVLVLTLGGIALIVFARQIIEAFVDELGFSTESSAEMMGVVSMYFTAAFLFGCALRNFRRILVIGSIDKWVYRVDEVKSKLMNAKASLDSSIELIEKNSSAQNIRLISPENLDAELDQYALAAGKCVAAEHTVLDGIVSFLYWVAALSTAGAVLALTMDAVSIRVGDWADYSYKTMKTFYVILTVVLFILIHIIVNNASKAGSQFGVGTYTLALISEPAAWGLMYALIWLVSAVVTILAFAAAFALFAGIIAICSN